MILFRVVVIVIVIIIIIVQWLIDGFDSQEKTKLDTLTSKYAKFFFYRENEVLQANNLPIKKVKHSVATEDYIAIEKIQSQNWQYFVESVLEACRRKNSGESLSTSIKTDKGQY